MTFVWPQLISASSFSIPGYFRLDISLSPFQCLDGRNNMFVCQRVLRIAYSVLVYGHIQGVGVTDCRIQTSRL